MKRFLSMILVLMMSLLVLCSCGNSSSSKSTTSSTSKSSYSSTYSSTTSKSSSSSSSFSNKYGTATTKCAKSGCKNYIAKSGDTMHCTTHSNKCGQCKCYIDGDAMFCMDCLKSALG